MKIDSVDFFYLSMPKVLDIGDGSQDALLVRVSAGGYTGWGECEASPLVTIAALVTPMSHSACKPVSMSVVGQTLERPEDITRIHTLVRQNSLDLLQADHALSGIDIALWDVLGKCYGEPTYRLLGYAQAYPKLPYASFLFGETAQDTYQKAKRARAAGFRAVKCGWGGFGLKTVQDDIDQVQAAREGLGPDGILCIDAGTVWQADFELARMRLDVLRAQRVTWLEEPFHTGALDVYRRLARVEDGVPLAGGEGAHNVYMAQHMIDYGGVRYIQIDAGRIGGLTSAKAVADYAEARGVTYVNHTFTSHLALSASIQPYAGLRAHTLCEYPSELSTLAYELTSQHIVPDSNGEILVPDAPGLGIEPDTVALQKYLVDTQIMINGQLIYQTPTL